MIVVWRVTDRCNLSCPFCAYDRRLPFERSTVDPAAVERLAPVLDAYQKRTGDKVLLSWLGGEPLLWQPVFSLSRRLVESFDIGISATTNGSTLHLPRVQSDVLRSFKELTISVDGFAEFHNAVRGWPGGWEKLSASVRTLARARTDTGSALKLRANVVLMRDNLGVFASLCEELANWGFDEITFNQLGGRDRPEFFPDHRLRSEDARSLPVLIAGLQQKLALRGVRLCANSDYLQRIQASADQRLVPVPDCGPGERFLFIDELGRVSPCHFTSAELGIPLQEVTSVDDLLQIPEKFSASRRLNQRMPCSDCPSTQVFAKFVS